jgi:hypothetical protein
MTREPDYFMIQHPAAAKKLNPSQNFVLKGVKPLINQIVEVAGVGPAS